MPKIYDPRVPVRLEAPHYGGFIIHEISPETGEETGRTGYVQTDWDFPSLAEALGWSLLYVQPERRGGGFKALKRLRKGSVKCQHDSTDGTITCEGCKAGAGEFIGAAGEFLWDRATGLGRSDLMRMDEEYAAAVLNSHPPTPHED